jgi:PAS domain-containing protein
MPAAHPSYLSKDPIRSSIGQNDDVAGSRQQNEDTEALDMKYSMDQLRTFINSIPKLASSSSSNGSAELFNRRWLDYTGLATEEALGSGAPQKKRRYSNAGGVLGKTLC